MSENAGVKMARDDIRFGKELGKEVFTQGHGEDVFLTAGCMLPFSEQNFMAQIENAAQFQGYATSGSILHHFVEIKLEPEQLAGYISKIFEKPINYMTITTTLAVCQNCGKRYIATDGLKIGKCSCGSDDISTYSRVIGYVKAISRKKITVKDGVYIGANNFWSKARRVDWAERQRFTEATYEEVMENEDGGEKESTED